jgi:hypothetical protein
MAIFSDFDVHDGAKKKQYAGQKPKTSPSEILIRKVELKTLKQSLLL